MDPQACVSQMPRSVDAGITPRREHDILVSAGQGSAPTAATVGREWSASLGRGTALADAAAEPAAPRPYRPAAILSSRVTVAGAGRGETKEGRSKRPVLGAALDA
jgi:hypothetical protein